jgi:hypothetical protein
VWCAPRHGTRGRCTGVLTSPSRLGRRTILSGRLRKRCAGSRGASAAGRGGRYKSEQGRVSRRILVAQRAAKTLEGATLYPTCLSYIRLFCAHGHVHSASLLAQASAVFAHTAPRSATSRNVNLDLPSTSVPSPDRPVLRPRARPQPWLVAGFLVDRCSGHQPRYTSYAAWSATRCNHATWRAVDLE